MDDTPLCNLMLVQTLLEQDVLVWLVWKYWKYVHVRMYVRIGIVRTALSGAHQIRARRPKRQKDVNRTLSGVYYLQSCTQCVFMFGRVGKEWPRPPQWRAQTERHSLPPNQFFMKYCTPPPANIRWENLTTHQQPLRSIAEIQRFWENIDRARR